MDAHNLFQKLSSRPDIVNELISMDERSRSDNFVVLVSYNGINYTNKRSVDIIITYQTLEELKEDLFGKGYYRRFDSSEVLNQGYFYHNIKFALEALANVDEEYEIYRNYVEDNPDLDYTDYPNHVKGLLLQYFMYQIDTTKSYHINRNITNKQLLHMSLNDNKRFNMNTFDDNYINYKIRDRGGVYIKFMNDDNIAYEVYMYIRNRVIEEYGNILEIEFETHD